MRNIAIPIRSFLVVVSLLLASSLADGQQPATEGPLQLPQPFETIQNAKKFNAVQFGPGNTFSIAQTPPDFRLSEFSISSDGRLLAMGWGSGRIELWDLHTKKRVSEFKSDLGSPGVLQFDDAGKQLIVTGSGGKIAFLGLPKGKKLREWTIPLGKYKYDIQQVVLDPNGRWLAYADEESSKVLDLAVDTPTIIADLKDAGSIALSQDGSELWTVDRSELVGFNTATWEALGHWTLKSTPVKTSPVLVRTGVTSTGKRTVAVPSSNGLVVYREPDMSSEYATAKPTFAVAFAPGSDTYVNFTGELTFLNGEGKILCKKFTKVSTSFAISKDGQWLAISKFDRVDLWRMEDLLRDCVVAP
jgi:hypothetical protein